MLPPTPPISPLHVVHAFAEVGRYAAGDRGVELAGVPGQRVVSATAGTVTFAGSVAGRGVVSVTLGDGRRLTYEPLTVDVRRGDHVAPGAVLGRLSPGWSGCPAAACLHWGLATGHGVALRYADPLSVLRPARVRLLPLTGGPAPAAYPSRPPGRTVALVVTAVGSWGRWRRGEGRRQRSGRAARRPSPGLRSSTGGRSGRRTVARRRVGARSARSG